MPIQLLCSQDAVDITLCGLAVLTPELAGLVPSYTCTWIRSGMTYSLELDFFATYACNVRSSSPLRLPSNPSATSEVSWRLSSAEGGVSPGNAMRSALSLRSLQIAVVSSATVMSGVAITRWRTLSGCRTTSNENSVASVAGSAPASTSLVSGVATAVARKNSAMAMCPEDDCSSSTDGSSSVWICISTAPSSLSTALPLLLSIARIFLRRGAQLQSGGQSTSCASRRLVGNAYESRLGSLDEVGHVSIV